MSLLPPLHLNPTSLACFIPDLLASFQFLELTEALPTPGPLHMHCSPLDAPSVNSLSLISVPISPFHRPLTTLPGPDVVGHGFLIDLRTINRMTHPLERKTLEYKVSAHFSPNGVPTEPRPPFSQDKGRPRQNVGTGHRMCQSGCGGAFFLTHCPLEHWGDQRLGGVIGCSRLAEPKRLS